MGLRFFQIYHLGLSFTSDIDVIEDIIDNKDDENILFLTKLLECLGNTNVVIIIIIKMDKKFILLIRYI